MDQKRREATGYLQADTNGKAAGFPTNRAKLLLKRQDKRFPAYSWAIAVKWTQVARFET